MRNFEPLFPLKTADIVKVPTYCYQCVCGPDLLKVVVKDGVPVAVEPNFDAAEMHPAAGRSASKHMAWFRKCTTPTGLSSP